MFGLVSQSRSGVGSSFQFIRTDAAVLCSKYTTCLSPSPRCVYLLVYAGKLRSNKEINKQINIMNENVCSERSTRWRVRENTRQSPSVWHFFKQLGVWLFSALTTTSTVGSKISAAELKISGFSLLLVVPEMCLAGITVKQQEMEPRGKTQNLSFILRWRKNWKCPMDILRFYKTSIDA